MVQCLNVDYEVLEKLHSIDGNISTIFCLQCKRQKLRQVIVPNYF